MTFESKWSNAILGLATIAVVLAVAPISLSADPLTFSSSGSTYTSAGVGYTFSVDNYLGSYGVSYESISSGSDSAYQNFSFTVDLPSLAGGSVLDASLNLSADEDSGAEGYGVNSGSQGSYYEYTYSYGCGFFDEDTCYQDVYGNSWQEAEANFSGTSSAVIDSVTDGTNTWSGSISDGSLDLVALGFGNDLLSGNVLTISGYRDVNSGIDLYNSGFNSYSNFNVDYNGSGSESATLTMDADDPATGVPEPATISLMVVGLAGLWKQRRRRSVNVQS